MARTHSIVANCMVQACQARFKIVSQDAILTITGEVLDNTWVAIEYRPVIL